MRPLDERAAVRDADPHRSAVVLVRDRDVATEAPALVRGHQGASIEPFARSRPTAVVAIPNAVLAGDARFFLGQLDANQDNAFEKILGKRR